MKKEKKIIEEDWEIVSQPLLPEESTAFLPHTICPYQVEKDLGDMILEIGFQNGRMYQITKPKTNQNN